MGQCAKSTPHATATFRDRVMRSQLGLGVRLRWHTRYYRPTSRSARQITMKPSSNLLYRELGRRGGYSHRQCRVGALSGTGCGTRRVRLLLWEPTRIKVVHSNQVHLRESFRPVTFDPACASTFSPGRGLRGPRSTGMPIADAAKTRAATTTTSLPLPRHQTHRTGVLGHRFDLIV